MRLPSVLIGFIGALAMALGGCGGANAAAAVPTTSASQDPGEPALPPPQECLAYVQTILKDKTRLIEVFNDHGLDGILDSSGPKQIAQGPADLVKGIQVVSRVRPGEVPFRVSPNLGIEFTRRAQAAAAARRTARPWGRPDVQIRIYTDYAATHSGHRPRRRTRRPGNLHHPFDRADGLGQPSGAGKLWN